MGALETLQAKYNCQLLFVESGGDNLAANYSRELADYIIYVIDVSVFAVIPMYILMLTQRFREETRFREKGGLAFHSRTYW
jgi:hypothetical protein